MAKCELLLWLGSWNGHTNSPVNISWSSVKVKVLGVFLGPGNLEEENWRLHIILVENALNSWRQRSLSYHGRALVINALALSHRWYVASVIHVPRWVSAELNTLIFKFFCSSKRDLVARRVVVQPSCLGRVAIMVFWFSSLLGAPLQAVFSSPSPFTLDFLPPFYRSLLLAWRVCKGLLHVSTLGIGSGISGSFALFCL